MAHQAPRDNSRLLEIAHDKFHVLPRDTQAWLKETFDKMDRDRDGSVTWEELQTYFSKMGWPPLCHRVWRFADFNGDDRLTFLEVFALFCIKMRSHCDVCTARLLDDDIWVCTECCRAYASLPADEQKRHPKKWVVVCTRCAKERAGASTPCYLPCFEHPHPLELVRNQWDREPAQWDFRLTAPAAGPAAMSGGTCNCCGEYHAVVPSYLTGLEEAHLQRMGNGSFLCEWCTHMICSRCCAVSCDTYAPQLRKWQQQAVCGGGYCPVVHGGGWSFSQEGLCHQASRVDRRHCHTCRQRMLHAGSFTVASPRPQGGQCNGQGCGYGSGHGAGILPTVSAAGVAAPVIIGVGELALGAMQALAAFGVTPGGCVIM